MSSEHPLFPLCHQVEIAPLGGCRVAVASVMPWEQTVCPAVSGVFESKTRNFVGCAPPTIFVSRVNEKTCVLPGCVHVYPGAPVSMTVPCGTCTSHHWSGATTQSQTACCSCANVVAVRVTS